MFYTMSFYLRFVVHKVALGQISVLYLVFPVNIILAVLHTQLPVTYCL
jgi:hypothetical protein